MAQNITANDNNIAYGVKKIMVDNAEELKELPFKATPGSKAIDTSTMDLYLLDNHDTWIKIRNLKTSEGDSGGDVPGGGDTPGGGGGTGSDDIYIWDGGDI